jgi:hypothetical protein
MQCCRPWTQRKGSREHAHQHGGIDRGLVSDIQLNNLDIRSTTVQRFDGVLASLGRP